MGYLDITFVLDRSGSMETCKNEMDGAMNEFVSEQRKVPGKVTANLYQFDTIFEKVYEGLPLDNVPACNIVPRNGTALQDAMVRAMDIRNDYYNSLPADQRPDQILFVIITDGEENASQAFEGAKGQAELFEIIKDRRERQQWEFIYLGANQDAIKVASGYGIHNSANYVSQGDEVHGAKGVKNTMQKMSQTVTAYRNTGQKTMEVDLDKDDLPDWVKQNQTPAGTP